MKHVWNNVEHTHETMIDQWLRIIEKCTNNDWSNDWKQVKHEWTTIENMSEKLINAVLNKLKPNITFYIKSNDQIIYDYLKRKFHK